ncbi:MAG: isochorismatase family protein [Phycisphaerae bacterium]
MPHVPLARREDAVLVIVDMQERMMPAVAQAESVIAGACRAVSAAAILGVPVLATEQNPEGLGGTIATVQAVLPRGTMPLVKCTCSCWGEPGFRAALGQTRRECVVLAGVETHVCIQQTAIELLRVDHAVFVLADATGSRRAADRDVAFERMRQAGAVVTTVEAMIFEWVERCDAPEFRRVLELVKPRADERRAAN